MMDEARVTFGEINCSIHLERGTYGKEEMLR